MRKAYVFVNSELAGILEELENKKFRFTYQEKYVGQAVSLTLPTSQKEYLFDSFPSFFEGLLPEGIQLEILLKRYKIDKDDYFGQLLQVGQDMVGAVTVEPIV